MSRGRLVNRLEKLKAALVEESLRNPNAWSSISIVGSKLLIDKAQGIRIEEDKRRVLESIVRYVKISTNKINNLLDEMKDALLSCGYNVRGVKIKALSRVIIGMSETFGKIPFEVGLSFDPFLNVPYIPGSSIKGAVRAGTFELLYNKKRKEGLSAEDARMYADSICQRIFGDKEYAGLIGFTDAYPVKEGENRLLLYPDVMAPHYKDVETELDVSPKPVIYLTIAPGTTFRFYLFYRKERGKRKLKEEYLAKEPIPEDVLGFLDQGLLYAFIKGVGAKTALGYSIFSVEEYSEVKG